VTAAALAAAALGALLGAAPGPPPAPPVVREVLPGGLELLVVTIPGADTASLRLVIRAGSVHDPPDRAGLAHLLEHRLAQGEDGRLLEACRAEGAELNAFTSRDATRYHLDAPAAAFAGLAVRFLRGITTLLLDDPRLERELAVVSTEEAYSSRGPSAHALLEAALFRGRSREPSTIGRDASRMRITRAELLAFYRRAYVLGNMTLVVTGPLDQEAARALASRAFAATPPGAPLEPVQVEPTLPATVRRRAAYLASTVGYPLRADDRAACEPLAELLERRLDVALRLQEPLVREVAVRCLELRGTPFILATAYGPSIEATDLPARMERLFQGVAERQLPAPERRLLEQRLAGLAAIRARDPQARAEELGVAAGRPRRGGPTPLPQPPSRAPAVPNLQPVAARAFRPERRVLLLHSPFEQRRSPAASDDDD
jgi:predicted Zn-dependent peptidase